MMKNTEKSLLKESNIFIEQNFNILSNAVPEHLIRYWIVLDNDPDDPETIDKTSIFMLLLIKNRSDEGNKEFQISTSDFNFLFEMWQTALLYILTSIRTERPIKPFNVFNFEKLKTLDFEF